MIRTIDVKYKKIDFKGIKHFRIDSALQVCLTHTHRDHEIVGFEWNPDDPGVLGIIFRKFEPG